ncbi:MAG: helix-turn-helix domain-containing protein [Acidimicrobiales bacterium]
MSSEPHAPTSLEEFFSSPDEADLELDDGHADVGSRIEEARVAAGIDRETFGAQVGVDVETVATWESGEASPRSNQLVAIAGILGVSPPWLMIGHGESPGTPDHTPSAAPELAEIRAELEGLVQRLDRVVDALPDTEDSAPD